jgi:hypothetical protein
MHDLVDHVSGHSQSHPIPPSLAIVPTTSTDSSTTSTGPTMGNHRFCDLEHLNQTLPGAIIYAEDRLMSHLAFFALFRYRLWFRGHWVLLESHISITLVGTSYQEWVIHRRPCLYRHCLL